MSFSEKDKIKILRLKASIASYYSFSMKKIGDRPLEALFYENCVISGGCISSLFHSEKVHDIDIYPKSAKALNEIKAYIISNDKNIKCGTDYNEPSRSLGDKLVTPNAVTLTNDVQFIYIDIWDKMKKTFDFIHCQPSYDLAKQKLYISEIQYDSIKAKTLIANNEIKTHRLEKYVERGWNKILLKI